MDVKVVAVAGVIVERRRKLDVKKVREFKFRPHLPSEHKRVGSRGELSFACHRLRRCRGRTDWIFWVFVVVNELAKVCEEIESEERLRWWRHNGFSVLAE